MKKILTVSTTLFVLLFIIHNQAIPAGNRLPKEMVFNQVNKIIAEAKKIKADLYVPQSFSDGMEYYNDAEQMYDDNDDNVDIEKALKKAEAKFEKAIEDTRVASVFFKNTMIAREDAISVKANELDVKNWIRAEEMFRDAGEILEDGDTKDSKEKADEAERLYRNAELKAIQSKYLKEVWALLNRAENIAVEDYAPITLNKAKKLSKKSESLLHLHRYDQNEAARLASQAEYEVKHAITMARKIKQLEDENQNFESIMLATEGPLQKIAVTLNMNVKFDQGVDIPTKNLVNKIKILQDKNVALSKLMENEKAKYLQLLSEKDMLISSLEKKSDGMEKKIGSLTSSKEELWKKVERERIQKEKIARISASFSKSEGKALLDGSDVIIRLYGLTFPKGQAVIEPQYFNLLSKIKNSFSEFPNGFITVEGHTDSVGSDETNQRLSEERAEAVRQYIIANSNIKRDRIYSVGYGESRPVASNETEESRAKNRRIDFIIHPSK